MKILKQLYYFVLPPRQWRFTVLILSGIFVGILVFVFHVSNAASYISDESETCINCHVMYPYFASWDKSSHATEATCAECHVPQDNFFSKYYVKATDGLAHATWFTFRWEPQVIRIKDRGRRVVQQNCISCHIDMVDMVQIVEVTAKSAAEGEGKLCWDCHVETPHGSVRSLSAAPHSLVERLPSVIPAWLEDLTGRHGSRSAKVLELPGMRED